MSTRRDRPSGSDDLSPAGRRGFAVTAWVWVPALMAIALTILLLVRFA